MLLNLGELTEEQVEKFKNAVNAPADKIYNESEMEIWPDDATDEEIKEIIKGRSHMNHRYPIVTLCGSTRFKDEFEKAQKELTLKGYAVISVGLFGHSGDDEVWENMSEDTLTETKIMLDDMHKQKIDMADSIYVINPDGYIGTSTWSEIRYAFMTGKGIESIVPIDEREVSARVDEAIEKAELKAWQNQDAIIHQGEYAITDGMPYVSFRKEKIYDPWWTNDSAYNGEPLSSHGERNEPFEKYGKQKMARFVEEVNLA